MRLEVRICSCAVQCKSRTSLKVLLPYFAECAHARCSVNRFHQQTHDSKRFHIWVTRTVPPLFFFCHWAIHLGPGLVLFPMGACFNTTPYPLLCVSDTRLWIIIIRALWMSPRQAVAEHRSPIMAALTYHATRAVCHASLSVRGESAQCVVFIGIHTL